MNLDNFIQKLYTEWKKGNLGGEKMPEDDNPSLDKLSEENLLYFTLPMALNYQRNSYKLWDSALLSYNDEETKDTFIPSKVVKMSTDELRLKLIKHKVALQQNKQTEIWQKICQTIENKFNGKILNLLEQCDFDVIKIKKLIQETNKKDFPYLSGNKICNYWLHVLLQYTDFKLKNIDYITVAPDTHVIQATTRLGMISGEEKNLQTACVNAWAKQLTGTELKPIDIHTALWLWSRNGFKDI